MPAPRNTATRDRHRAIIAKGRPPCALCGEPIDYTLPYMDPGEYVVDHIVPRNRGGSDTLDNKQPAHRRCNRAKSDRVDGGLVLRRSGSLARPR
ncbi:HNH endonuclease [Micromonospora costi]|uniref:HNH endonuclease n=1 Tax=Micromonospora costi TaxID=1530042 RepID=UPI00340B1B47